MGLSVLAVAFTALLVCVVVLCLSGRTGRAREVAERSDKDMMKGIAPASMDMVSPVLPAGEETADPDAQTLVQGTDSRLREALAVFVRNEMYLDPDMSLEKLSDLVRTNRSYLNEALHQIYGQTYNDFINCLRIHHAQELIRRSHGAASLKSVSIDSGYRSQTTFYRNFVRVSGCPPADWRHRVKVDHTG